MQSGYDVFVTPGYGDLVKPIPTLETERLSLRPFVLDDAAEVQRLAGDRSIADTTLSIPHPYEDGMAEEWIEKHQPEFDQGKGVTFAITRKTDGSLVGAIGLMGMVAGHQAELGYWIGRPYWNQGFCTEACESVLRYAFSELGLIRVHCCHFSRNPASGRVMRKLGMGHEGCRRQHVRKWDVFEDLELYGILKSAWMETASKAQAVAERARRTRGGRSTTGLLAVVAAAMMCGCRSPQNPSDEVRHASYVRCERLFSGNSEAAKRRTYLVLSGGAIQLFLATLG